MSKHLRARGYRGTHGLVQMVREQVAVLVESTGKMAHAVDVVRRDVNVLAKMVGALAETVDELDTRIEAVERKVGKS